MWSGRAKPLLSDPLPGRYARKTGTFPDLPSVVLSRQTANTRKDRAMTEPDATQQDTELNPESATDETTDVTTDETPADEAAGADETAGFDAEAAQEGVTADYQERLREFDGVESVPVTSVPVPSSELKESDLKVESPGGQSG